MGFDWCVNVTVVFSQPIALPENVSYWYLLKNLANYEPGESARKRPRSRSTGLVTRGGDGYDEEEVEGGIGRSCTEVETRFQYNPKLRGAAWDREADLKYNWPELLSEAFAEAAEKTCGPGHGGQAPPRTRRCARRARGRSSREHAPPAVRSFANTRWHR